MDIKWHESVSTAAKNLITSDSRIVRIWNPQTVSGNVFIVTLSLICFSLFLALLVLFT